MAAVSTAVVEAPTVGAPALPRRRRRSGGLRALGGGWLWLLIGAVYIFLPIYSLVEFTLSGTYDHHWVGLHWYAILFADPTFRASFWLSVQVSFETVIFSVLLIVPTAYFVHLRLPRLRPVMDVVAILPFVVPPIVLIVGIIPFLSGATWLIGRPEVLPLIYAVFALPFLYRSVDNGLRALDLRTLSEAAESLGASGWRTFWRVAFPNLRSAVTGGSLLTIAIAFGEYTVASLLSFNTFPVEIYLYEQNYVHRGPAAAVISLILIWATMVALFLVLGRRRRTGRAAGGEPQAMVWR
jgi:putative spermidine/putrescine transport system permease protein